MDETTKSWEITLADLLAAFSLATDLGLGQPMSHLLRAWQIAVRLEDRLRVSVDRPALFYVAMLAWVGCVADAPEVAANFGDDIAFRADSYDVDLGGMAALAFFLSHAGAGGSLGHRARSISALLASGGNRVAQITTTQKYLHSLPDADAKNLDALNKTRGQQGPETASTPTPATPAQPNGDAS